MINISGTALDIQAFENQFSLAPIQLKMLNILHSSHAVHNYTSNAQLFFELTVRKNIIDSSIALYSSHFSFRTFRNAKCNLAFWTLTEEGGFLLKSDANPFLAIRDIYSNSSKYGTECATAIVIVFFKSLTNTFSEQIFNQLFPTIYLMDWQRLSPALGIINYAKPLDFLPGDCRYFKNPDVNPLTPEWQGENAIDLGNATYYGHGIGIRGASQIIGELNKRRITGSQTSAYLMDNATRPDFKRLSQYLKE